MAEDLIIDQNTSKEERYMALLPQIEALVADEPNLIANMANTAAALKQTFGYFWIGFYIVEKDQLVLGPFQGPVACTRINKGKGVCGTVWSEAQTIIVPNVDEFPGHIACSSASKSEIVVPGFDQRGEVCFVLDIDSDQLNEFDALDQKYLESIVTLL